MNEQCSLALRQRSIRASGRRRNTPIHDGRPSPHTARVDQRGANLYRFGVLRSSARARQDFDPFDGRGGAPAPMSTTLRTAKRSSSARSWFRWHLHALYDPTGAVHLIVSKTTANGCSSIRRVKIRARANAGRRRAHARRAAHDHGAGHTCRRHAPHRLGHDSGLHSFHRRLALAALRLTGLRATGLRELP